ncbi:hypothetical protein [Porphyrobacter sp. GA68]|uniref:hypothetical protein n=1 Tax=Porphyrobacter sp. GA68 TaxID=2883480 RepID=UPI001D190B3E|nr:hypothetical protein [Porphyrobacter sp. GA68]
MQRWMSAATAALVVASCASVPSAPQPQTSLQYTDLTDEFAAAYDRGAGLSDTDRAAAIRHEMEPMLPGFYDPARFGQGAAEYEGRMANYMAEYPARRDATAAVARRFAAMFDPAVADFERRIGPLPTYTPVLLVVSMGEFDGATRDLGGRSHLLFGADMIAQYHGGEARAFVQHELFHIYHGGRFAGCAEVWCALWSEGLATYAAQQLNPGASDAELLLTIPNPIRPALETHRAEAVCAVLARLNFRDLAARNALFSGARLSSNLPPRFGYLVGLWVAADLGSTRSLNALAEWNGPELRAAIERSLGNMADCT